MFQVPTCLPLTRILVPREQDLDFINCHRPRETSHCHWLTGSLRRLFQATEIMAVEWHNFCKLAYYYYFIGHRHDMSWWLRTLKLSIHFTNNEDKWHFKRIERRLANSNFRYREVAGVLPWAAHIKLAGTIGRGMPESINSLIFKCDNFSPTCTT